MPKTAYGYRHKQKRAAINRRMKHGEAIYCWSCGVRLQAGPNWHLDHIPGTDKYRGPACIACNTSDGARRGNRQRHTPSKITVTKKPTASLGWRSRTW